MACTRVRTVVTRIKEISRANKELRGNSKTRSSCGFNTYLIGILCNIIYKVWSAENEGMVLNCARWSRTPATRTPTFLQRVNEAVSYLGHFQNCLRALITEAEFNKALYERRNWHFAFYLRTSGRSFGLNGPCPRLQEILLHSSSLHSVRQSYKSKYSHDPFYLFCERVANMEHSVRCTAVLAIDETVRTNWRERRVR